MLHFIVQSDHQNHILFSFETSVVLALFIFRMVNTGINARGSCRLLTDEGW